MLIVLLKFVLSHILGDFVFQTKKMVIERKHHVGYLLLHVLIHAVILIILFANSMGEWWQAILFVVAMHLAIDSLKIWWERKWPYRPLTSFLIDQVLHLLSIGVVIAHSFAVQIQVRDLFTEVNLLYLITAIMIIFVSPIFMRVFFSKWNQENAFADKKKDTLLDAGLVIGVLERLIIVVFIQANFLAGIGFLMGAKSIFRFGDLTNAKNTKFTEYILVGTLLSFALAILIGFGLRFALDYVSSQTKLP